MATPIWNKRRSQSFKTHGTGGVFRLMGTSTPAGLISLKNYSME
jgi:hypothetical protein